MTCIRSERFASIAATGSDWRDVTRQMLAALEAAGAPENPYTLGFLYISDLLVDDIEGMLDLIRSVTGIPHWVGAVGVGVCGLGVEAIDRPAAAMMVGSFPPDSFHVFPPSDLTIEAARGTLEPWLDRHDAMLTLVHGDPTAESDPAVVLSELEHLTGGFVAGGLSASRRAHRVIADHPLQGGIGGVVFSSDIAVATTLSQGCAPLGAIHTVTRCDGNVVMELDGRNAFTVFGEDVKIMALAQSGQNPKEAKIAETLMRGETLYKDVTSLFRGDIHVAFPVPGSDQRDYLVRNIVGLDPDSGWMVVPPQVEPGQTLMFVHRSDETVEADLGRALGELRARLSRSAGRFNPQGALYISCVARSGLAGREMQMIRETLGDVPLAGFYANGEISNRRLYGYTGVLILFL